jgi:hypothetical protein
MGKASAGGCNELRKLRRRRPCNAHCLSWPSNRRAVCIFGAKVSERGSVSPLVAGYLALILLVILGSSAVGVAVLAGHRVQGVADFALLYAHDRSHTRGQPDEQELRAHLRDFLDRAPSVARLHVSSAEVWVEGQQSNLRLCARYIGLFDTGLRSFLSCRTSSAQSFLVD